MAFKARLSYHNIHLILAYLAGFTAAGTTIFSIQGLISLGLVIASIIVENYRSRREKK